LENDDGENTVDLEIVVNFEYSMASTKDQIPGRWTECYNVNEGKIEALVKEQSEMPPRHFETVTKNLTLLPGELALEVATNPYNCILLLGMPASKKVQMIHHHFTTRDSNRSPIITQE
jgi:hypothetical protein